MKDRRQVCMALDPVADVLASGRSVNRHCVLDAGHEGMHESRDANGMPVHGWMWSDVEHAASGLVAQETLF